MQTVAAISEHFYVDNERPTAAQHAKQMSWRIERFAATYRSLHSELQEYLFQRLNHKDRQSLRPPPSLLFAHEPMPGIVLDEYGCEPALRTLQHRSDLASYSFFFAVVSLFLPSHSCFTRLFG